MEFFAAVRFPALGGSISPRLRWLLTPPFLLLFAELWAWVCLPVVKLGPSFRVPSALGGLEMRRDADAQRWCWDYSMHWTTGAQGYRGESVSGPPPPGTRRVLALGNSQVFGVGVNDGQTWAALTEARLSTAERPLDVVNAAITDAGTEDFLLRADALLALQPDLVVLRYNRYNARQTQRLYRLDADGGLSPKPQRQVGTPIRWLETLNHTPVVWSALYAHVRSRFGPVSQELRATAADYRSLPHTASPPQPDAEPVSEISAEQVHAEAVVLRTFADRLHQEQVPLLLLRGQLAPGQDHAFDEMVARPDVYSLDVRALDDDAVLHFKRDEHFTAAGHEALAAQIAPAVSRILAR